MSGNGNTQEAERYYYANGAKIPLTPSTHFLALRAEGEGAGARLAASLSTTTTDMQNPVQVLDLPEYNLVVLEVPPDGTSSAMAGRALSMASDMDGGTTEVYELADMPAGAGPPEGLVDVGEIIVKYVDSTSQSDRQKLLRKHHLEVIHEDYPEPGAVLVKTTREGDSAIDIANALHEEESVEYASPNFVRLNARLSASNGDTAVMEAVDMAEAIIEEERAAAPAYTPNDPALAQQWGLQMIRAPEAWDISQGDPSITVAVVDEGGAHHEDYVLASGWDALENDADPTSLPADGHGTACAGIAAATGNNGKGGAGVAPSCRIRHIRIARGIGGGRWFTTDAIASAGIRKAVDLNADVLSNSYRLGPSTAVTNAFKYAASSGRGGRGAPMAAATANDDVPAVAFPARLSPTIRGLMAVGASNQWDQRKSKTSLDGEHWWGSNYGPEVDVVAPGVKIYTTDIMGAAGYSNNNYVPTFNGTSSATPHVAGLMALILSVDPNLRGWEVEDIIKLTAKELGPAGRDNEFGFGRIDARKALEAASKIWYQVSVTPVFLGSGKECYIRANVRMYNPGINTVRLNSLVFRSHGPGGVELDRFEYRPNPGVVMQPRTSQEVRLNRILLPANGTQASWSYNWTMNWTYTYWRPSAPVFPLTAGLPTEEAPLADALGTTETSTTVSGQNQGGQPAPVRADGMTLGVQGTTFPAAVDGSHGDTITVDRQTREITVVIR